MPRLPIVLLLIAFAAGCSGGASRSSATATPSPAPPVQLATPAAAPSVRLPAIVTASPSPAPVVTATPLIPTPTPAALPAANVPPRIEAVSLSENTVHSGDRVLGRVRTSPNTASVEARLGGYSLNLTKVGVGTFKMSYQVPWLPFFFHGRYQILLIARNTAGAQTRRIVPIVFQ